MTKSSVLVSLCHNLKDVEGFGSTCFYQAIILLLLQICCKTKQLWQKAWETLIYLVEFATAIVIWNHVRLRTLLICFNYFPMGHFDI